MIKKVLIWLGVAFLVYYLVSAPAQAADAVRTAGEGLQSGVSSVLEFFDGLTP